MSDNTPSPEPSEPTPSLWRSLREDRHFRTTFVMVFGLPAVLVLVVLAWVLRAIFLG